MECFAVLNKFIYSTLQYLNFVPPPPVPSPIVPALGCPNTVEAYVEVRVVILGQYMEIRLIPLVDFQPFALTLR